MKKDEYSIEDIVIVSSTESLLKRPSMYTSLGTAEEVYAFLCGSNDVITNFRLKVRPPTPQHALDWLYNEANSLGGSLDFTKLRNKYGSDKAIFTTLLEALQKFRPQNE